MYACSEAWLELKVQSSKLKDEGRIRVEEATEDHHS
jgi:hypothetical protein